MLNMFNTFEETSQLIQFVSNKFGTEIKTEMEKM